MKYFRVVLILLLLLSCRSKGPHNPYLDAKLKPSEYIRNEYKKEIKKTTKQQRRMLKRNKRNVNRS